MTSRRTRQSPLKEKAPRISEVLVYIHEDFTLVLYYFREASMKLKSFRILLMMIRNILKLFPNNTECLKKDYITISVFAVLA